jgi:hypothetical protein
MLQPEVLQLVRGERQTGVRENTIQLDIVQVHSTGGLLKYYGIFGGKEQVIVHEFYGRMSREIPIGSALHATWPIENGLFIANK